MKTETRTQSMLSSMMRWCRGRSQFPRKKWYLCIAIGCIIVGAGVGVFYATGALNGERGTAPMRMAKPTPPRTHASVTISAGAGSEMIFAEGFIDRTFEDGSRVLLPPGTKVIVDYTPEHRWFRLVAGEMTVHVAEDPNRPLSVQADQLTATAVGTIFTVTRGPTTRVHVIEGTVKVEDGPVGNQTIGILKAGQSYSCPTQ